MVTLVAAAARVGVKYSRLAGGVALAVLASSTVARIQCGNGRTWRASQPWRVVSKPADDSNGGVVTKMMLPVCIVG